MSSRGSLGYINESEDQPGLYSKTIKKEKQARIWVQDRELARHVHSPKLQPWVSRYE